MELNNSSIVQTWFVNSAATAGVCLCALWTRQKLKWTINNATEYFKLSKFFGRIEFMHGLSYTTIIESAEPPVRRRDSALDR